MPFVELVDGVATGRHPGGRTSDQELTEMFTIEEESGTYTGPRHRHNGYYAGDFSQTPMRTPRELAALAQLRPPLVRGVVRTTDRSAF